MGGFSFHSGWLVMRACLEQVTTASDLQRVRGISAGGPVQSRCRLGTRRCFFSAKVGGSTERREATWERSTPKDIGRFNIQNTCPLHFLVMRRICFDMTVVSDIPIRADSGAGKVG